jgi:hypothetical protein
LVFFFLFFCFFFAVASPPPLPAARSPLASTPAPEGTGIWASASAAVTMRAGDRGGE